MRSRMLKLNMDEVENLIGQAEKASRLLKAMSHQRRFVILCILAEQKRTVSEVQRITSIPQPVVSQQLARLRLDRLVNSERKGRRIYYTIADDEAASLIEVLFKFFCEPLKGCLLKGGRKQALYLPKQSLRKSTRTK